MFFEHVSVLNSQSVLRNDVTSYALARWVWDLFWVEFYFFFIVLAPRRMGGGLTLYIKDLFRTQATHRLGRLVGMSLSVCRGPAAGPSPSSLASPRPCWCCCRDPCRTARIWSSALQQIDRSLQDLKQGWGKIHFSKFYTNTIFFPIAKYKYDHFQIVKYSLSKLQIKIQKH